MRTAHDSPRQLGDAMGEALYIEGSRRLESTHARNIGQSLAECELEVLIRSDAMKLLLVFLAACATAPVAQVPVEPAKPIAVAPPPVQPVPAIDEATVKSRTHEWYDALDRADIAGFTAPLGASFIAFERARFLEPGSMTKGLQTRIDQHQPVRSRTWAEERVFLGETSAVFIGEAIVKRPASAEAQAGELRGYHTVVWAREGDHWSIVLTEWHRSGIAAEREDWNEAFQQGASFNKKPNALLVSTIKGRKPGTALDIAMGQGRNALYLASQGWKTTGVDISDEGIRQAQTEAVKQKLKLETVQADLDTWDLGTNKWDLVTLIYAGSDAKMVERIKPSLKKGGLFVCEYFSAESEVSKSGAGGWGNGELAALFKDGYKILRDEIVEDNADWAGMRKTKLVRFVAQKL